MKTNFKTFAHKLIALVIAVIMASTAFTGALTAFAAEQDRRDFHDSNLAANFMTWAETTDEQTAEALLDWADLYLGDLLTGLLGSNEVHFDLNIVVASINLHLYLDSVDGLIDAVRQANDLLGKYGGLIGGNVNDIKLYPLPNLHSETTGPGIVSKCGRTYRQYNSAKDIIMALAQTLYLNTNDNGGKNVIGAFIKGELNLGGIINSVLGSDVYTLLKDKVFNTSLGLNLWDGYQSNLAYNIVAELIFHLTEWYSDAEVNSFEAYLQNNNNGTKWVFDDQLFNKLSTELLQQINVEITYPGNLSHEVGSELKDTSRTRYAEIQDYIAEHGGDIASASVALGYDPNLNYTDSGNVRIFQYGSEKFSIKKTDDLLTIAKNGLKIAWKTCLEPTIGIVHVNYDVDRGHGANFDNEFYYWMRANDRWDEDDWKSNYNEDDVMAWATAVYGQYKAESADEFLGFVRNTFEYDRSVVADPQNNWKDINPDTLFNKLRYNPLADLYFDMQTGPINLYFMQTGATNISDFFNNQYKNYDNILSILNDVLVAAVKDFFPDSKNIGIGDGNNTVVTSLALPTLDKTSNVNDIATTLVSNALAVFEYAANVTDENILNPFYAAKKIATKAGNLTEQNFEEAMIPLLIACLQKIEFAEMIHDEKWDSCNNAEGVAYVALEEYLSYVLPNKDYAQLISKDKDGFLVVELGDIEVMARDAVGYLLSSIVPCRMANGKEWDVYKSDPATDTTTLYEILNSVVCYYAGTDEYKDGTHPTTGKAVASLLGVVDGNGVCQVKLSNTLWQNIDNIANKVLPLLGTLITGREGGKVNSYDLIYNKIIKGILDIGPNSGVTTILNQLLTIFNAAPLHKGLDVMIYDDLLADTINAIFGARDSRQGYKQIIPKSSYYANDSSSKTDAASPFDALVQSDTLARYSGGDAKQNGILGILISNIYEFFGGNMPNYTTKALADGCWTGAMFAVKAVNNFIPSFVPQLSEHTFKAATAILDNASRTGVVANQEVKGNKIEFKNNSIGLNRFWRDENGKINQDKRYFVNITDFSYTDQTGTIPGNITVESVENGAIAPETTVPIIFSIRYRPGTQLITFKITYNVFEGESGCSVPAAKDCLYTDLQAVCYLYVSNENSWESAFYSVTAEDTGIRSSTPDSLSSNTKRSTTAGTVYINTFNTFIMSSAHPEAVDTAGLAVTSTGNGGIDGVYSFISDDVQEAYLTYYEDATEMSSRDDIIASYGSADELAYANFDKATGDVINIYKNDLLLKEETDEWDTTGYTDAEINEILESKKHEDGSYPDAATRKHIAYTFEDAIGMNVIRAYEKNDAGEFTAVYVDPAYIISGEISPTTQIDGLDMVSFAGGVAVNSATTWVKWLKYDGTTTIAPQNFRMNIAGANTAGHMVGSMNFVVSNDNEASTLSNKYNSYLKDMAPYGAVDFNDFTDKYGVGQSNTYDKLQTAFQNVVTAISKPVTIENAASLASTFETVISTETTTYKTGDVAYKPMTADTELDAFIAGAYEKDGYLYRDADFTQPIYSNVLLTDADVTDGKDAVGQAVIKGTGEDTNYYLANDLAYEYKWDTKTYNNIPYYGKTNTPAVDGEGNALYSRTHYQFLDANGNNVGAADAWKYKYALTTSQIKANDGKTDYRGFYQQQMDSLDYWVAESRKNINAQQANLIGVGIKEFRAGLENVNYNVASYEKMVKIAKGGEALISTTVEKDENDKDVTKYSTSASSVEVKEAVRIFNQYYDRMIPREYEGRAINNEILCAAGVPYTALNGSVEATETDNAVVKVANANAADVRFGKVNAAGELVNEASVVYTAASWKAYITALAHAAVVANNKTDSISSTYGAKKELQIAENNLEIDNSITLAGTVYLANDAAGSEITDFAIAGAQIIVDGEVVATTDENGEFTATISKGTTEVTIDGKDMIARTVSMTGDESIAGATVCVVNSDFNQDGKINTVDASIMAKAGEPSGTEIDAFKNVFNKKVAYTAYSLD